MLSPPTQRPLGPTLFAVLGQSLSTGMGFAALAMALYAQGPASAAAALFGAVGVLCGAAAASLRLLLDGVPAVLPAPMPADALATLLRTMLAQALQDRQASRSGSAADRRPAAVADPLPGQAPHDAPPLPAPQPALARRRRLSVDSAAAAHRLAGDAVQA